MAYRVLLADGSYKDYYEDDQLELHPSGALLIESYGVRITYAPHAWVRVVEQTE